MTTIRLSDVLSPAFREIHDSVKSGSHNQFVLKGGRGSAKSSFASVEVVLQLIQHPNVHAVVMRKVANTLRTSVYAQYVWAMSALGLNDKFKCTVSPMELIYLPTGQKIMFFGADDPGKVKSIKVPFGYIGILHFEELDQFSGENEVRNLEQSILRGGDYALEFKTFNPPRTRNNWANQYCLQDKPGQMIHHSTFLTTPREWLGERFLDDADYLKTVNPSAYEHEYMGVANGTGGAVFDNIELRRITDDEIRAFDRIYMGVDFGWYPDPAAFLRVHYDKARETIYLLDELVANKLPNTGLAEKIKERGYADGVITCDSAEKKSVADLRDCGLQAQAAVKGPGSVEYGMKWLQKRKIVIDRQRTPYAAGEFTLYEYERTKDGEIVSGYPDRDNHTIDALRYALEPVFLRRGSQG